LADALYMGGIGGGFRRARPEQTEHRQFRLRTSGTPACPQPPWLPTNTGESDALQILIQSTKGATLPTPPPPPEIIFNAGSGVR
jgi:hypothetical protein